MFLCFFSPILLFLFLYRVVDCYNRETLNATVKPHVRKARAALIGVWLASVLLMRIGVLVIGIALLFIRHESLRLTIPAKVSRIILL